MSLFFIPLHLRLAIISDELELPANAVVEVIANVLATPIAIAKPISFFPRCEPGKAEGGGE